MFKGRIKITGEIANFNTFKNKDGEIMVQKDGSLSFFRPEEVENVEQLGWRPASELPPENTEIVIWTEVHSPQFENAPVGYVPILGRLIDGKWPSNIIVKYWCYLPEKE